MDDPAVATRETEDEARDRMEQLMRRSKIGLLEVEQRLGVQGNVIAMYVLGSRLWGSATDTSDYDLVLVANQREPHRTLHWGNVDALVYSPEEWQVCVRVLRCRAVPRLN
jgi:predicted nucleotidyltransferase